jgi:uncharacterized membrane protein
MDAGMIFARIIHIGGGTFWIGAMIFVTFFLAPAVKDAGPDGAKVMAGIGKRNFMQLMPGVAVFTLLSGIYLYWRVSGGFDRAYMMSGPGHAYAIGGLLATVAFAVGLAGTRPAMLKSMALAQAAATAAPDEREKMLAQAQQLRERAAKVGLVVVWLLIFAVVLMAVGRYL